MTNPTDLKKELESFKSQMQEVNQSLDHFECQLHVEQIKIYDLRNSFANLIKLINHELVKSFNNSGELLQKLSKDK